LDIALVTNRKSDDIPVKPEPQIALQVFAIVLQGLMIATRSDDNR
jgi:hypothetical protein